MYGHKKINDPACEKSKAGYIITVADCLVILPSKLQSESALSTMDAEVVALANSCRELLPIIDMFTSLDDAVGLSKYPTSMHASEDNAGFW